MSQADRSSVVRLKDAEGRIPSPAGEHFVEVLRRGTLTAKLSVGRFAPRPNQQTPHAQDELYVVVRGRGVLLHDGKRDAFEAGDLMFVAAGTEHRFEEFSDDLAVWVLFYGREGGEVQERGW
jgi:mannose-6-phosphate isomerase-like protein (cupin superfamily)